MDSLLKLFPYIEDSDKVEGDITTENINKND